MKQISFQGSVIVRHWVTGKVLRRLPTELGLSLAARSTRWDSQHVTADVRKVDKAEHMGIAPEVPITFENLTV